MVVLPTGQVIKFVCPLGTVVKFSELSFQLSLWGDLLLSLALCITKVTYISL